MVGPVPIDMATGIVNFESPSILNRIGDIDYGRRIGLESTFQTFFPQVRTRISPPTADLTNYFDLCSLRATFSAR